MEDRPRHLAKDANVSEKTQTLHSAFAIFESGFSSFHGFGGLFQAPIVIQLTRN